jgi:adenylate cyclase
MSDLATRIGGFASRTSKGLRSLRSLRNAQVRLQASTRQAELEGLQFAFYARLTAIVVVSVWLIWLVPWPRDLYYGTYAFGFFLLGYIPYRVRHHRHGEAIKLGFIVLDVALVTAAILIPPPASLGPIADTRRTSGTCQIQTFGFCSVDRFSFSSLTTTTVQGLHRRSSRQLDHLYPASPVGR